MSLAIDVLVAALGPQMLKLAGQMSPDPTKRELDILLATGERAASTLADAKPDIIVFHCTGHAMEEGPEGDARTREMIARATGIAATSTAAAIGGCRDPGLPWPDQQGDRPRDGDLGPDRERTRHQSVPALRRP